MAHLVPFPFGRLVTRVLRDVERGGPLFNLPRAKVVRGLPHRDLSVSVHGHPAATPVGPAAGPHTQLAQNIALAYLGGCRVFELKTVQVKDELVIPRPCIDMRTVGFNVEWSQELKLEQSLEEYAKASMLLEILAANGALGLSPGFERFVFDMSVGYDLAGIRSERVRAFLAGMLDASAIVERLRREIPEPFRRFRDLPFRTRLSDTLTLSTFHGCPPSEIEGIAQFLMEEVGLHTVVKLNPTLLGPSEARRIFNGALGYRYRIPDAAFANDPTFEQACELIGRLEDVARRTGRGLGVKFSNTLVVENEGDFLPKSEASSYLSGPPLHVLAMSLVSRFRSVFGDRLPVSFSAGIDRHNLADALSLGLVPVTVCSDLLRTGGYGRLHGYFAELESRMAQVGATSLEGLVLLGQGQAEAALSRVPTLDGQACRRALPQGEAAIREAAGDSFGRWVREAKLLNTGKYVETLLINQRYAAGANAKAPKKVGSTLELFDCLTCDKCVPVCPNDANFTYLLPSAELPMVRLRREGAQWVTRQVGTLAIKEKHQLANFADFCNECGNCDVFCPEDGGPYILKPRFFGSADEFWKWKGRDGFFVGPERVLGRFRGQEYQLALEAPHQAKAVFSGEGFSLALEVAQPEAPLSGHASGEVDLTYFHILLWLQRAVLNTNSSSYLTA